MKNPLVRKAALSGRHGRNILFSNTYFYEFLFSCIEFSFWGKILRHQKVGVCSNILPKSHLKMLNTAITSCITALIRARTLKMSSITKPFEKRPSSLRVTEETFFFQILISMNFYLVASSFPFEVKYRGMTRWRCALTHLLKFTLECCKKL